MKKWIITMAMFVSMIFFTVNVNAAEVRLTWKASANATGYRVFYGFEQSQMIYSVDAGQLVTYTVKGLDCGTQYHFHVKAYNDAGESFPSFPASGWAVVCVELQDLPDGWQVDGLILSPIEK